jgi:hypothetical protein
MRKKLNGKNIRKKKKMSQQKNVPHTVIATVVAEIATLPICTIKTNFQNSSERMKTVVKDIYNRGGIFSFYNASLYAVSSQVITTTCRYTLYRKFNDMNFNYTFSPYINKMLDGMFSGVIVSLITHPLDLPKVLTQMNKSIMGEIKLYGLKVFYRGYSKTLIKVMASSSLFFPLYDFIHDRTENSLISSFSSAVISTTITHPIDYLKIRHMYNNSHTEVYKTGQVFRGLSLNLFRIVPHFMIIMTGIDFLNKRNFFPCF